MTTPSNNPPAPRLPSSSKKPHTSAAGLLGRTGSGGFGGSHGLNPIKPTTAVPSADLPAKHPTHADAIGPAPAAKHTGKPETRRPTGRAISGG